MDEISEFAGSWSGLVGSLLNCSARLLVVLDKRSLADQDRSSAPLCMVLVEEGRYSHCLACILSNPVCCMGLARSLRGI